MSLVKREPRQVWDEIGKLQRNACAQAACPADDSLLSYPVAADNVRSVSPTRTSRG